MWTMLTIVIALCTFIGAWGFVALGRRRPPALAAPIAFSVVVAFEAVLLPVLSAVHAYARGPVLAVHVAALLGFGWVTVRSSRVRAATRRPWRSLRGAGPRRVVAIVPVLLLGALLAIVAAAFVPNNWDSMTYRLARIAHWIQHRSVAPYGTGIDRQVALTPGAEYVLGAWQAMAGSDRLANFLQLAAWAIVAFAAAPLLRMAGAGRRLARIGVVMAATVPMAVLQATSTQNDLVAAAVTVGVIAAVLPFLGSGRLRASDAVLLGVTLAAASLVKPTAVVFAGPFVAWAIGARVWRVVRGRDEGTRLLRVLALAAIVTAAVALPDATVRLADPVVRKANAGYAAQYLYPPLELSSGRLLNLVRGVARHLPIPGDARAALDRPTSASCSAGLVPCEGDELRPHEDYAGNPFHVLLFGALAVVAVVRRRALPTRARVFLGLTCAGWALFQVTFRDNEWITRLETPGYALSPIALVALAHLRGRVVVRATALSVAALLALAARTVIWNQTRPLRRVHRAIRDPANYYAGRPELRPVHDAVLTAATGRGCRRLGLRLGGDSWDYPLTWRALQAGIEVRHVFGPDPWPCLVFVDGALPDAATWRPVDGGAFADAPAFLYESRVPAAARERPRDPRPGE